MHVAFKKRHLHIARVLSPERDAVFPAVKL